MITGHPLLEYSMQQYGKALATIDEGYEPMDFSQFEYDEKPYDYLAQQKDIDATLKGVQLGKMATKIQSDPKTHSNTVTYDFEYNPQALKDIAQRASVAYQTNPKVAKWIDNSVVSGEQYHALNPTFKEAYGRDIQSGEDKYTAMLLLNAKQPYQQQAVQHFNQFEGQHSGSGGANGGSNINDVYGKIEKQVNDNFDKKFVTRINSLDSDAQSIIVDFAKKVTGDNDINYADMVLSKNSDGSIGLYNAEKNEKGLFKLTPKQLIATLPRVGTNLKVQPSVQEKRKVIEQGNQPATAPKSTAPAKKTIKKSDIAAKAAASGYSADEYEKLLKQNGIQIVD